MYLSDQLKNFKRNSGGSKDVTIKHEQITKNTKPEKGHLESNTAKANLNLNTYKHTNTTNNLFGLMNKKNKHRSGSFDSGSNLNNNSQNISFTKRTASAKRQQTLLSKAKHSKNKSMEIEPTNKNSTNRNSQHGSLLHTNKPSSGPQISFSVRTRKGKSHNTNKVNQDSFITQMNYQNKDSQHLFGCYDGHGVNGHLVKFFFIINLGIKLHLE